MKDIMSSRGGFASRKISGLSGEDDDINTSIWTTLRINKLIEEIDNGLDIKGLHNSPFKDNDINLKRAQLPFEYTPEEWNELVKCKEDILYFAYNYCYIQTSKGIMLLKDAGGLRDFQEQILLSFKANKYNILMASRQIGKSVTSAIFILWFSLFHAEKTALIVADNFTTTKELMDKFRIALDGLPFFMKPGIKHINSGNIKFDNDSRIVGRTTTKKSGIGLTVNLLYIDEFAHIDSAKLDEFYRAIFPTITADPNAKVVITSTPNGKNKFYDIWVDAIEKKSNYVPLRVDWWQVAGRDEKWKEDAIADLGSIDDFNQEYGLQFFSSDQLLLGSNELKKLNHIKTEYEPANLMLSEDRQYINDYLFFHPKYKNWTLDDFKNDPSNYVFTIDTADGIGGDYSVLNIFKLVPLPVKELLKKKDAIRSELDTISLVQIGVFRTNELDITQFAAASEFITYNIFNPDKVRIVLEMNHKGDIVHGRFSDNSNFWTGQFVHTKHTEMATNPKLGLRLGPTNKIKYCEKFKYLVTINKIIPNEYFTFMELMSFGKSRGGVYRGQNGNDDLAMTCVNLSPYFDSSQFWDQAIDSYELTSPEYRKELEEKIFNVYRDNAGKSLYNFDELRRLNGVNQGTPSDAKVRPNVFDLESIEHIQKIKSRFFKT
jgi:Terminase large subunit, T4likevirus-type, N-terminal